MNSGVESKCFISIAQCWEDFVRKMKCFSIYDEDTQFLLVLNTPKEPIKKFANFDPPQSAIYIIGRSRN